MNISLLPPIVAVRAAARRLVWPRRFSILVFLGTTSAALAGMLVLYIAYCVATLPLDGGLAVEPTPSALVVEADDGQVFASRGVFKGEKLAAEELPNTVSRALVAIEDRRFYEHGGIDLRGIFRAAWRNLMDGRREGGSTITQQLARLTYLSLHPNLKRKIQEAVLALWLERHLSKDEILVRYLNTAFFGAGAYGVDAAARRYFGKSARRVSLMEAATLAGLVHAPSVLAPDRNPDGARERAELVLDSMVETGAISRAQAEAAKQERVVLRVPPDTPPGSNYFVDTAAAEVKALVGGAAGDLRIRTTIDRRLQAAAERAVARHLAAEGRRKNIGQAAVVALAPDGAVLALVGGRDYRASQFNRASQAKRQPGSLFKLFVYLAALQKGLTPDSMVVDRPVQIGNWEPENFGGRYRGAMSARNAFANSVNTVAVQLADAVGLPAVIEAARKLGVQSELPAVPSLALGSAEVTLIEMTRAFAAIAANIEALESYTVRAIGKGERALFTRTPAPRRPALDPALRADLLELLVGVVNEGTGRAARLGVPAAGKTGTSQDFRDAWFVGFTPDIVVGVWVGNDDNASMKGVTGGSLPAAIWREVVAEARPARKPRAAETVGAGAVTAPPPPAPAAGTALRGVPRVVDTGTLELDGQTVRLHGVEGIGGRAARVLGRMLRQRAVLCEPVGEVHRCRVGPVDLAHLVIVNGAAQASDDAPPELRAAQEEARAARRGIWRRR